MSESIKSRNATLARIAGNLLSDLAGDWLPGGDKRKGVVRAAVETARDVMREVDDQIKPIDKPGRVKLLNFLHGWRERLLQNRGAEDLLPEESGQLITLNTIIYYIDTEI
jgi:hypothetical protein